MLIVQIDSVPTQLFLVNYRCRMDLFDPSGQSGPQKISGEIKIKIENRKIIIGKPSEQDECGLTKIPEGVYTMYQGNIGKKK